MKLLTQQVRKSLPKLYANENLADIKDAVVRVKYFTPFSSWTWYATEGEPVLDEDTGQEIDFRFFGFVDGIYPEWGYFHLSEMEGATAMRGKLPLVERDLYFGTPKIKDIPELREKVA